MLAKHWDSFAIGFFSIIGAFAGGLYWGCTSESPDYLSVTTNSRVIAVELVEKAKSKGQDVCIDHQPHMPAGSYWLHSC